jgi:DNA-binding LacI/PurR family transcriptional regulator
MPTRPASYQSLAAQVAARIGDEIRAGTWQEWLPGERTLTDFLQVSRKTLRKAIAQLQRDGTLVTTHGLGHRIAVAAPRDARRRGDDTIGLLTPESLENLRPYTALWVDELRALLIERGARLTTFAGHRFFKSRPDKALARLVQQNPQTGWVLAHTNEQIQQWFYDQRVPCVIAGSCHHGLSLPSVDWDNFALCRHAAGAMLRLGHRRVALLTRQSQRAGDLESEAGFVDGVRRSRTCAEPIILRHDGTAEGVNRVLARLFSSASAPTAILIANTVYYLSAITFLAQRGLSVPRDVSLVSRNDDTFLNYITPAPARYTGNAKTYAKRLLQPLHSILRGEPITHPVQRIEPTFVAGASLTAPRPS